MPYISPDGTIREAQPWGLSKLSSWLMDAVNVFILFFQTLVNPSMTGNGRQLNSNGRQPGSGPPPPPRRRMGRISRPEENIQCGPAGGG